MPRSSPHQRPRRSATASLRASVDVGRRLVTVSLRRGVIGIAPERTDHSAMGSLGAGEMAAVNDFKGERGRHGDGAAWDRRGWRRDTSL